MNPQLLVRLAQDRRNDVVRAVSAERQARLIRRRRSLRARLGIAIVRMGAKISDLGNALVPSGEAR